MHSEQTDQLSTEWWTTATEEAVTALERRCTALEEGQRRRDSWHPIYVGGIILALLWALVGFLA